MVIYVNSYRTQIHILHWSSFEACSDHCVAYPPQLLLLFIMVRLTLHICLFFIVVIRL